MTTDTNRMRIQLQESFKDIVLSEVLSQKTPITTAQVKAAIDAVIGRAPRSVRDKSGNAVTKLKAKVDAWPPSGVSQKGNVARETFKAKIGGQEKNCRIDIENWAGTNCIR